MITIAPPIVNVINNKAYISCEYKDDVRDIEKELWYRVDIKYKEYLCPEVSDSFVLLTILPAIKTNQNIYVKGSISSDFYFSLKNTIIPTLSKIYGANNKEIAIICERIIKYNT